jgi:hypothetical protein
LAVLATPATGSAVEALRPYGVGDPAHLLGVVEEQVGHRLVALAVVNSFSGVLATLFDRLGRYEPAATVAGFALGPLTGRHPLRVGKMAQRSCWLALVGPVTPGVKAVPVVPGLAASVARSDDAPP